MSRNLIRMAHIRKSALGVITAVMAVCLVFGNPVQAVNLKSRMAKNKEPLAFAQVSLATATQLEMQAALQAAIQEAMSEQLGALIEEEIKNSDIFDNVKGVASSALGDMFGSLKKSMGETCQRFAALAQKKLDSVDDKLKSIAGGDSGSAQGDDFSNDDVGYSAAETAQSAVPQPMAASAGQASAAPIQADRLAFLQLELRNKHKGFFDKIKSFAKKGFNKLKAVGRTVKKGLKSVWGAIKPAIATGVRSAVNKMKAHVPGLIGKACDSAEEKLEHLESKVVPDDVDAEINPTTSEGL